MPPTLFGRGSKGVTSFCSLQNDLFISTVPPITMRFTSIRHSSRAANYYYFDVKYIVPAPPKKSPEFQVVRIQLFPRLRPALDGVKTIRSFFLTFVSQFFYDFTRNIKYYQIIVSKNIQKPSGTSPHSAYQCMLTGRNAFAIIRMKRTAAFASSWTISTSGWISLDLVASV